MQNTLRNTLVTGVSIALLSACSSDSSDNNQVDEPNPTPAKVLVDTIEAANISGLSAFILPASDDFSNIPQDPNNLITAEKVALGQMLYHETGIATAGVHPDLARTWSCASCHHADAGFKAGVPQGMGEGGSGFGTNGAERRLANGFDKASENPAFVPDVQPFTSPAVLNVAFQEVMLWNGQFGNMAGGVVNISLADNILATPKTPKAENVRQLAGVEIQAIAGTAVHRLNMTNDSVLQTNDEYVMMFEAAYPDGSDDVLEDAGKAIAAYERTIVANQAPFQLWLNGDETAMTEDEIAGATLFFGKANCVSCHTGPALSSSLNAAEKDMFMAIGFADFDPNNPRVTGTVSDADAKGRGGFTGEKADNFKFKIPQLYNLADTNIFGHGASFTSVRDVIAYKNAAVLQKVIPMEAVDSRFVPLGLTEEEIDQLTAFLESALYDPDLGRYKPDALPTGACFPVADSQSIVDLSC